MSAAAAASAEWFGKLAYMSFLLGPDAPAKPKQWRNLSEQQRAWFRASATAYIDESPAPPQGEKT